MFSTVNMYIVSFMYVTQLPFYFNLAAGSCTILCYKNKPLKGVQKLRMILIFQRPSRVIGESFQPAINAPRFPSLVTLSPLRKADPRNCSTPSSLREEEGRGQGEAMGQRKKESTFSCNKKGVALFF